MKNKNQFTIQVQNGANGLDVFLNAGSGKHYITTRRPSGLLWSRLRNGISIGELRRTKPYASRKEQKYYKSTRYLLRIVDDYIDYKLTA